MDCFGIQCLTQIRTQPKISYCYWAPHSLPSPCSLFLSLFEVPECSLSLSLSTITEGSTLSLSHAYPHSSHYCTAYVKSIRRHVLPDPHPFRERVPRDLELVGTVHRLHHRRRHRGCQRRTRQRRRRTRIRKRGLAARKHQPQIRAFSQNPPHHDNHDLYK